MAEEREPDVGPVAVEHPGTGPDHRFGLLEVAELLDAFARDDRDSHRIGENIEEPRERLLHDELDRVPIDRLDAIDGAQHVRHRVPLDGEEPLDRVAHVLGGELPPRDRWVWMPSHPPAQPGEGPGLAW